MKRINMFKWITAAAASSTNEVKTNTPLPNRKVSNTSCQAIQKHSSAILFAIVSSLVCTTAFAQDKNAEIDKIFSWIEKDAPGCVCAVSQNGQIVANRAYGLADLERGTPLTTSSVFDAGSVVKQFVAASVLLLVENGRLSLTEDIRKYIPELPDYGSRITLDHLMTHTSGIRDWTGLKPLAEGDPDALTLTLRQRGLNFKPGDEWAYSNSGYVLLKEIVARVSGMPFSRFTQDRLFTPLQMSSTRYVLDMNEVVKDRVLAYKKEGAAWKLDVLMGNDRGGGGALFSTPADLAIWNEALTSGKLGAFVTRKLQEQATLNNGRKLSYARGLNIEPFRRGGQLVWHSGGAAGYSTNVGRLPQHGLSVAIMCNVDGGARSAYAARLFNLFLPAGTDAPVAGATDTKVDISPAELNARAGLYFNEQTGQPVRLIMANNALTVAGAGPLVPLATDRFHNREGSPSFLSEAKFELTFTSADAFEINTTEGEKIRFRRARAFAPASGELSALAGRYESTELGTIMEIVPEKEGIQMRFYRNPSKSILLKPADENTFMTGMMTVRFVRDSAGKVTGFDYGNPLVRNIRFGRANDVRSK
ncbi:serine hydrolase [Paracnuella aquatica]|nr:serine hydrolase [Paracnuella aquatica]